MSMNITIKVNGELRELDVESNVPLLYILRNDLELNGAKFGCGLAQCGACSVMVDGVPIRSCITPVSSVTDADITTLEGLGTPDNPHPLQQAFIDEQAMQCGYCVNGVIMNAAALLAQNPRPSDDEVRQALDNNLCRCGAQTRMLKAIKRAVEIGEGAKV
jgi:nicotinate dehydrogenase subunit A